jgi:hypothetical protein
MTVMLLALLFSDAALNSADASEYRFVADVDGGGSAEPYVEVRSKTHKWTPRVERWTVEKADCPAFFQREIAGFGQYRVGPRCREDDQLPHAL